MAHEQVPRQESPYVPDSGAVGELGQPRATEPGSGYGAAEGKHPFHGEGKHHEDINRGVGEYQTGQTHQQQHPLLATQDANIGHRQEPFASSGVESEYVTPGAGPEAHQPKRGMGEKMKAAVKGVKDSVAGHKEQPQHQYHPEQANNPRFTDKLKDAVTGQKPGQGAATGYAASGGALAGEEDYAGKTGPGVGVGHTGAGAGIGGHTGAGGGTGGHTGHATGVGAEQKHASSFPGAGDQHHQSGWPQPVPPPGIYNPNASNPSGGPTGGHFSPHAADSPNVGLAGGRDSQQNPLRDHVSSAAPTSERHHQQHSENKPYAADSQGVNFAGGHDSQQSSQYSDTKPYGVDSERGPTLPAGGGAAVGEHHHGKYSENKPFGDTGTQGSQGYTSGERTDHSKYVGDEPAGGNKAGGFTSSTNYPSAGGETGAVQSTPAAPNARHDTPTAENTGGATYTDPTGAVHQEGPRDDNVKKEGLMAKMMDKLHLSPKHKDKSSTKA